MNKKKKKSIKKGNIVNFNFSNYILFIIIIFLQIISSKEENNKLRKINVCSEIMIKIKVTGSQTNQKILNKDSISINGKDITFNYLPSKVIINNFTKNITNNMVYNLNIGENNITMIFNTSLKDCNVMFYELTNVIKLIF